MKAKRRSFGKPYKPRRRSPYSYAHQLERERRAKVPDKICGICHRPILPGQPWHLDHVVPISMGGQGGPTQPAHQFCNISKGGRNRVRR